MPQVINTNIYSLNAQRNLNKTQSSLQTSLERLSSGLRINKAKDDAAGLAISDKMTAQIRGLEQAIRNVNDGIGYAQTADGALEEVTTSLQRMRELAVQSANGTITSSSGGRANLNAEFSKLAANITNITTNTKFNGANVFTSVTIQSGADKGDTLSVDLSAPTVSGATGADISSQSGAQNALDSIDTAITNVASARATAGASQSQLESTARNLANVVENVSAARSQILDADFAKETANLTKGQILQQSGAAILAQANLIPQNVLSLLR